MSSQPVPTDAAPSDTYSDEEWDLLRSAYGRIYNASDLAVEVTPKLAELLLRRAGPNRRLKMVQVKAIESDLRAGEWRLNGETVKIDSNDQIRDGQHRLKAIVRSGVSGRLIIVAGIDPEAIRTVDTTGRRTTHDHLMMRGHRRNTGHLASASGMLCRLLNGPTSLRRARAPRHYQIDALRDAWPELDDVTEILIKAKIDRKLGSLGAHAAVYVVCVREDAEKAHEFFHVYLYGHAQGYDLRVALPDHPAFVLREWMLTHRARKDAKRLRGMQIIAQLVRAYGAYLEGARLRRVVWTKEEPFPELPFLSWPDDPTPPTKEPVPKGQLRLPAQSGGAKAKTKHRRKA